MIPDIGMIIAAYAITRMTELLGSSANIIAKIFAVLTILVTLVSVGDMLSVSSKMSQTMPGAFGAR